MLQCVVDKCRWQRAYVKNFALFQYPFIVRVYEMHICGLGSDDDTTYVCNVRGKFLGKQLKWKFR